jgi:hypothetical protein
MFPSTYTWTAVLTNVQALLAEPIVQGGTLFVLGIAIGPKLVRALRSSVSAR